MKVSSNERCKIPCEVFAERCWLASRFGIEKQGLMVVGIEVLKFNKSETELVQLPPRMLCSIPDARSGYKLYQCPYVTPTGRIRKWSAHYANLEAFRKAFIVRKIKKFFKEESEKLVASL